MVIIIKQISWKTGLMVHGYMFPSVIHFKALCELCNEKRRRCGPYQGGELAEFTLQAYIQGYNV